MIEYDDFKFDPSIVEPKEPAPETGKFLTSPCLGGWGGGGQEHVPSAWGMGSEIMAQQGPSVPSRWSLLGDSGAA